MTEDAVLTQLNAIFEGVFGRTIKIVPEMTADDVEDWDSTRMIELIIAAESHFGIKLTTREVDGMEKVGDFVSVIARKTAGK